MLDCGAPAADGVARAVIVNVRPAPLASESISQVTICAPGLVWQSELVAVIVRPAGTGSVTTTVRARDGPAFWIASVNVTVSPTGMWDLSAVLVTERSARGAGCAESPATLLLGLPSPPPLTVALFSISQQPRRRQRARPT